MKEKKTMPETRQDGAMTSVAAGSNEDDDDSTTKRRVETT